MVSKKINLQLEDGTVISDILTYNDGNISVPWLGESIGAKISGKLTCSTPEVQKEHQRAI